MLKHYVLLILLALIERVLRTSLNNRLVRPTKAQAMFPI